MNRAAWIIVALLICGGWFAVFKARGSNKSIMPFFGRWKGTFEPDGPTANERNRLEGFVQLYGSHERFTMQLRGEQQEIDLTGTWFPTGNRVTLTVKEIAINDFGGEDLRDPNKVYIPNNAVRAAYAKPLILNRSQDGRSLNGLTMSIGDLIGKHSFVKDSP